MYRYSSYWGTWSRVLSIDHPEGPYVEVDLTPVGDQWVRVRHINIRAHRTPLQSNDKLVTELPAEVRDLMEFELGTELRDRLLTEDFLPKIDWVKYKKKVNGGVFLAECYNYKEREGS